MWRLLEPADYAVNMQQNDKIRELKTRYKISLADKSAQINEYTINIDQAISSEQDSAPFRQIVNDDLHKLAGSSGMYGYLDIASSCRKAMDQIMQKDLSVLRRELRQLQDLLDRHASG